MTTQPHTATALVLGSRSPRRRELVALLGLAHTTASADIDESLQAAEDPVAYVRRMAREKAAAIAANHPADTWVIAADTTVVADGAVLGKPANNAEARAMLARLRNSQHTVFTAVTIQHGSDARHDLCATTVYMRDYSDDEIDAYVATGDPLDKAGGYAIQHEGFRPAHVTTCYANVVGLPLCHLTRLLRAAGLPPTADVPAACRHHTGYQCTVYPDILNNMADTT